MASRLACTGVVLFLFTAGARPNMAGVARTTRGRLHGPSTHPLGTTKTPLEGADPGKGHSSPIIWANASSDHLPENEGTHAPLPESVRR